MLIGAAVLWGAGWPGGALLGLFFLSGSVLSYGRPVLAPRLRGGRTWRQVAANGGWAAVGALAMPVAPTLGWALMAGALAAAQADTWATEIGRHARRPPRLLVGRRTVAPGTSGGVTWLGSAGGITGALALGGIAVLVGATPFVALWSAAGGIVGMVADSFLGSTVQARYRCAQCERELEEARHTCAAPAGLAGGIRWIDNDVVNAAATAVGGSVAILGAAALGG
jgi:uncharacterized protein (TIGR00297 family)